MPYSPQTWQDNDAAYPLSAARMTNIENGVQAAAAVADQGHRILTTAQRDALVGTTAGTMIYNSTTSLTEVWTGATWLTVALNPLGNHFLPTVTNTYDLGSTSFRWRNIYTQDLHLNNGIGDYTVVEGEEDLFLVNHKTGKSFKFALIEVDPNEVPPLSEAQ